MRVLSASTLRELAAAETGVVFAVLLTIDHADLPAPLRVTTDLAGVVQNGEAFLPYGFQLEMPSAPDGLTYTTRLALDAASSDRAIAEALLATEVPPTVVIQLIRSDDPDNPEIVFPAMEWDNVQITQGRIEGELSQRAKLADEPYPGHLFTPANHPGLFGTLDAG